MVRIEPTKQPAAKPRRKIFARIFSLGFYILRIPFKITLRAAFVFIILAAVIICARTGIWNIPVVSNIVYREPLPNHVVNPSPLSAKLLALKFEEIQKSENKKSASLVLSESELTGLLQERMRVIPGQPFSTGQISIASKSMEFYGRLRNRPQVVLRATLAPVVSNGHLTVSTQAIFIGQVRIPKMLLTPVISDFISNSVFKDVFAIIPVHAVELLSSQLIVETGYSSL